VHPAANSEEKYGELLTAGRQQGSQGGSQSAAGGQSAASGEQREGNNLGWIGLLGLIGLAGLRRRDDRSYDGTRRTT
jgi:MYXO-CTERM domain-containing protein